MKIIKAKRSQKPVYNYSERFHPQIKDFFIMDISEAWIPLDGINIVLTEHGSFLSMTNKRQKSHCEKPFQQLKPLTAPFNLF